MIRRMIVKTEETNDKEEEGFDKDEAKCSGSGSESCRRIRTAALNS